MPIQIRAAVKAAASKHAEIMIYEAIGENWYGDGLTARRFDRDLSALGDLDEITVRINSPGGAVFDGIAIYNTLKRHKAKVHVVIDGLAASAASIIAMAGDRITMGVATQIMIHNPWTIQMGDSNDMRKTADMLDSIREGMLDAYEARTGLARDELLAMVDAETWFTPAAAIEAGFADDVERAEDDDEDKDEDEDEDEERKPSSRASLAGRASRAERWNAIVASFRNAPKVFSVPKVPRSRVGVSKSPAVAGHIREVETMTKPAAADAAQDVNAAVDAARAANRARVAAIRSMFASFPQHRDILDACVDDETMTEAAAGQKLLAAIAAGGAPLREPTARIEGGADSRDKFVAGVSNAILARRQIEKIEDGNEWAGASLGRISRAVLRRQGVVNVERFEGSALASKVFATMSTSDFPLVLANTANKALRKAYESAELTWRQWCAIGEVSDFKSNALIQLGSFNSLAVIPEGGEYKAGTFEEEQETIRAETKGRSLALTRQMIINDDLGVFVRRASMLGFAAARTVNEDAYAKLQSNPVMSDTGALFNNTVVTTAGGHANLGTAAAIAVASLGAGKKAMALQKDKGLKTTLNIRPKFLLTPVGLEQTAFEVLTSSTDPAQANPGKRNYAQSLALTHVSDAALDAVSATGWYMLADPNQVPVIEVDFLDGQQTPYTDEMVDFFTDAMVMKVRLDYGVAAVDWRGGYKNAGL